MKSFRDYRGEGRVDEAFVAEPMITKTAHDGGNYPLQSWQKKWLLDMARHHSFEVVAKALLPLSHAQKMREPIPQGQANPGLGI